jgi:hypothetical protein
MQEMQSLFQLRSKRGRETHGGAAKKSISTRDFAAAALSARRSFDPVGAAGRTERRAVVLIEEMAGRIL